MAGSRPGSFKYDKVKQISVKRCATRQIPARLCISRLWERRIPFVPLMILPYLLIDLFFVAAPFLYRQASELRLYAKRVTLVILVAGSCDLLFPLRYAFPRPLATARGRLAVRSL